jgi:hypothetical protein
MSIASVQSSWSMPASIRHSGAMRLAPMATLVANFMARRVGSVVWGVPVWIMPSVAVFLLVRSLDGVRDVDAAAAVAAGPGAEGAGGAGRGGQG